jgi:myo-inositol-1(or 4)-monophosphatase
MQNEKKVILDVVKEAGAAILAMQKKGFSVSLKNNNDILTQADLLANQLIKNKIESCFPDDGWLSEENADDLSRLKKKRVWIIDPIDGTREYVKSIPEYAISVALVERHEPIFGVVYNPATDELFYAEKNNGAYLNDSRINCTADVSTPMRLLASRSEYNRGEWDAFKDQDIKIMGSIAYKLALVAAGRADATFSLGPKNEWDIAAGVLILQEAGGHVTDQAYKPFQFNQANPLVNGIVAASNAAYPVIQRIIDRR